MLRRAALVALLLAPVAAAFHSEAPLVATIEGEGRGWVAARIAGPFEAEFVAMSDGPRHEDGIAMLVDGHWVGAMSSGSFVCGADARVGWRTPGGEGAVRTPGSCSGYGAGWGWGSGEDRLIVAWSAGDVASWRFEVRGENASLVSSTHGGAIGMSAEDFSPDAAIHADFVLDARASTGGSASVHVPDVAFGWFDASETESSVMTGPAGERACPCFAFGEAAGDYRFDHAGAGHGWSQLLAFAPVQLPP